MPACEGHIESAIVDVGSICNWRLPDFAMQVKLLERCLDPEGWQEGFLRLCLPPSPIFKQSVYLHPGKKNGCVSTQRPCPMNAYIIICAAGKDVDWPKAKAACVLARHHDL